MRQARERVEKRVDVSGWVVRLDGALIERHVASGAWRNQTIADLTEALVRRDPQHVTHVFEGRNWTIQELWNDALALAGAFQARGLKAGDVIAFQLPNWAEAMVIDLAAAVLGLVVVPVVPMYRDSEVSCILADSNAQVMFVPGTYRGFDYLAMMQRLRVQLPRLRLVAPVRCAPHEADSVEAMLAEGRSLRQRPRVDANAVKLVMYTSGTTGRPKGVLHSHNTMAHTVRRSMQHWSQGPGDTMLMASPVTHVTGFGSGLELPLLTGVRTVFMERWNATEGVALIEREGATISMGATPFLQELLVEAERRGSRLPSLRIYACGGAAVAPALIRRAEELLANCRVFRVFGSTELPLVTLGFVGEGQRDLAADTDGEIVHYDVKITDETGAALPLDSEGEVCAIGPAMMLGYTDPAQTEECIDADGYFHTGDLGHLNAARAIVITGRIKDLINRGGEKFSAREIEDTLHRHPGVAAVAVVAMPHARLGEAVCAYVVTKPGRTLGFSELEDFMSRAGLAKQKCPERFVLVDQLPMTASGKVRKDVLREDIQVRVKNE
jgi:acyl-CoA synthetase (AMP-forming)/AMP-acid ligase II